jgi:hypothetical protein
MPTVIEIKLDKRLIINIILVLAVALAVFEAVELGLIAYSLKAGLLCK